MDTNLTYQRQNVNIELPFVYKAEVAHEFQTPLAILSGNLECLENENGIKNRRALKAMRETIDRLSRLVSRTLELARARQECASESKVDISILLEAVYDECTILADARGVTLALSESTPAEVSGSIDQLQEVLLNLISNALQHTKRGGTVALGARLVDQKVELYVSDTGCGIAPTDLPYVFDRFYRIGHKIPGALHDADARGTGLGLAICRQIVENHGGTIGVESEIGKGSSFTVSLPVWYHKPNDNNSHDGKIE